MTLSHEEARKFLEDELKIVEYEDKIHDERIKLLDEIVTGCFNILPWHNIRIMSLPVQKKRAPTKEECIQLCLLLEGGGCWPLNYFLYRLLHGLNFQVYMVGCSVDSRSDVTRHSAVIIKNVLKDGDTYFADIGFGIPLFHVVCMDFVCESSTYTDSFVTYKFVKQNDLIILKKKKKRYDETNVSGSQKFDGWVDVYYSTIKERDPDELRDIVNTEAYIKQDFFTNQQLRIVCFKDNKATVIIDDKVLRESDGKLHVICQKSSNITDFIVENLPTVDSDMINRAIDLWKDSSTE